MADKALRLLEWDSDFFQRKIYRFDLEGEQDLPLYRKVRATVPDGLVYLFSQRPLRVQETADFFLADTKVVFRKDVPEEHAAQQADPAIVPVNERSDDLLELALLSGTYSRFRIDPRLAPMFRKMYETWLDKSLQGKMGGAVYAYRIDGRDAGFVTVQRSGDAGVIGLIAVSDARQGKGIGGALVRKAEGWCRDQGLKILDVATQLANRQACNFYEKAGFTIHQSVYIYHDHITQHGIHPLQ